MAANLRKLRVTRIDTVDAGAQPDARIELYKRKESKVPDAPTVEDLQKQLDDVKTAQEAAITKAVEDATKPLSDELATLRKGKEEFEAAVAEIDDSADEATKLAKRLEGLPEEIRKSVEDQVAAIKKQADADRVKLEKIESENRSREFVAKAKDLDQIAGAAELGPVLEAVDRLLPEDMAKALGTYLTGANARLGESELLKERGGNTPVGDELEGLIKKHMDATPGASREVAIAKALEERPDLYTPGRKA